MEPIFISLTPINFPPSNSRFYSLSYLFFIICHTAALFSQPGFTLFILFLPLSYILSSYLGLCGVCVFVCVSKRWIGILKDRYRKCTQKLCFLPQCDIVLIHWKKKEKMCHMFTCTNMSMYARMWRSHQGTDYFYINILFNGCVWFTHEELCKPVFKSSDYWVIMRAWL